MRKATIKDVASRACVSTALVSRVMNATLKPDGSPDCAVHPDTAKRIFNAVAELGYHPNKAAVSLRKEMKKRIGVIIPDIANPFFADIARHIESIARSRGYMVLFGSSDENAEQLGTLAGAFTEDGVDGIIITPGADCLKQVSGIVAQGMPVVLTIRDIPGLNGVGRVLTDDVTATDLALEHLTNQGFSVIDMISPFRSLPNARQRENLFKAGMDRLGRECRIHHVSQDDGLEDVCLILEEALRRGVRALYCSSASLPVRILQAAREMKVRIPEDIALMGYDGGFLYGMLSPSVSQIEFSRKDIAREAFDELMSMISSKSHEGGTRYLKPSLTVGESTCPESPGQRSLPEEKAKELLSMLSRASSAINDAMKGLGREAASRANGQP